MCAKHWVKLDMLKFCSIIIEVKMYCKALLVLAGLSLLNSNPLSISSMNSIYETTRAAYWLYTQTRISYGTDVIINFENDNCIGASWFSGRTPERTWTFNFVRFDTTGEIKLDMREFKITKDYGDKYYTESFLGIPHLDYVVDDNRNSWLIYNYETEAGWRIGWVAIDSAGNIVEDVPSNPSNQRVWQHFITCPSSKFGYHLVFIREKHLYFNPRLKRVVSLLEQYKMRPIPSPPGTCIEIQGNKVLLIGYKPQSKYIHCQRLSNKGKLLSYDTLDVDKNASFYWEDVDFPPFHQLYQSDSLIYYLYSSGKHGRVLKTVLFDENGKAITPKKQIKGQILEIDQMPRNAKRFMKIYETIIYYYGFDNKGNLYYWNSREVQK